MFQVSTFSGQSLRAAGNAGVLRHPDGSIDFDVYREIARQERNAAIVSSIRGAGLTLSRIRAALAGKSEPDSARHQPHHVR